MFHTDTLSVKPVKYELDFDEEKLKSLRPFFKLHSGSYSRITRTFGKQGEGEQKGGDTANFRRKEKGHVTVELWDGSTSRSENLIGRGELNYDSLSTKEGHYDEWIPLRDRNGKQVGRALCEINIMPVEQHLSIDDSFNRSIGDLDFSFKRAIDDMNRTFEDFSRFKFPSLISGEKQGAIESGKDTSTTGQSNKQLSTRSEDEKNWMNKRRSLFDSTFYDMHNMFERALEDMHNRFEDMFNDFRGFDRRGIEGDKSKSQDLETEKSRYGQHSTEWNKETPSTTAQSTQRDSNLRDRRTDWGKKGDNVEIKDEGFKNTNP